MKNITIFHLIALFFQLYMYITQTDQHICCWIFLYIICLNLKNGYQRPSVKNNKMAQWRVIIIYKKNRFQYRIYYQFLIMTETQTPQVNQMRDFMPVYQDMNWIIKPRHNASTCQSYGGLALSNIKYCKKKQNLENDQIKAVLSICGDKISLPQNLQHLWIAVGDHPREDISAFFSATFRFIQQNLPNGNVLVHCQAGISRSASVVIAYLIRKNRMDFQEAFDFVRMQRPFILPNKGFTLQLQMYASQVVKVTKKKRLHCCLPFF